MERTRVDEATLISRALRADGEAFAELVTRYEKALYNVIWAVVRNHEAAQEIRQETFLRAYQHLDRFGRNYRFSTWLFRIGVNLSITRKRRERLEKDILAGTSPAGSNPGGRAPERDPDQVAAAREDVGRLFSAMSELPKRYQKILYLRYREGLSCTEIARRLRTTANSVSIVLHRAKERLRGRLSGDHDGRHRDD